MQGYAHHGCYFINHTLLTINTRFQRKLDLILGIMLPAITILLVAIFKRRLIEDINNNRVFRILEAGFLLMGSMYYLQENKWLPSILFAAVAFIILFLLWMEGRILQDQYILFEPSHIEVEFPLATKKYAWQQMQAVMIKNEFITLSFKDNTIHQLRVQPNLLILKKVIFYFFVKIKLKV